MAVVGTSRQLPPTVLMEDEDLKRILEVGLSPRLWWNTRFYFISGCFQATLFEELMERDGGGVGGDGSLGSGWADPITTAQLAHSIISDTATRPAPTGHPARDRSLASRPSPLRGCPHYLLAFLARP